MQLPALTLGIEEEYQIIDPETRELAPMSEKMAASTHPISRWSRQELTPEARYEKLGSDLRVVDRLVEETVEGCF